MGSPEMQSFGTVKQVECVLGVRMLNGEDLTDLVEDARADFIKEHGTLDPGYNPLRRTADGVTLKEAVESGDMEKVAEAEAQGAGNKKRRIILDSDYVKTEDLII